MQPLLALSRVIDAVTRFIGYNVRWLILLAILISATNAVIRKAFDSSSNAWLESQWLLFGAVFMLAAAYVLQKNAHVRIDVVSSRLAPRTRIWIDLVCHLLMLAPLCIVMVYLSWPFFLESYGNGEISSNAGGLIVWPSKLFVLLGFCLLFAQMISEVIKCVGKLTGHLEDEHAHEAHAAIPVAEETIR